MPKEACVNGAPIPERFPLQWQTDVTAFEAQDATVTMTITALVEKTEEGEVGRLRLHGCPIDRKRR
jgi:hypothetical protein